MAGVARQPGRAHTEVWPAGFQLPAFDMGGGARVCNLLDETDGYPRSATAERQATGEEL